MASSVSPNLPLTPAALTDRGVRPRLSLHLFPTRSAAKVPESPEVARSPAHAHCYGRKRSTAATAAAAECLNRDPSIRCRRLTATVIIISTTSTCSSSAATVIATPPQGDSCCCCCGRGHLKEPDSLSSTSSSAADRCVDFAARLSVRGVLGGLRESRSPTEDSARPSRGRSSYSNGGATGQTAETTCPHGRPLPNHPLSPDGDWAPFEWQSGTKVTELGVHSSVTSVRDVTVASGSVLTDAEKKTNYCNSHVTKADDGPVESSNPDLVSAAIGTQQQQQQLNGSV